MAKRFTDTSKWKDTWFQDLPSKYKLFWIYILDESDAAGVWKPNIRLASFQIGEHFEESELKRIFSERIEVTEAGYWWIKKFIEFQYGTLSEHSKPHTSVINLLKSHKIIGYPKGIHTLKDKDKEKEKEKEKEKDSDVTFSIERCKEIALADIRWVNANKATPNELDIFNQYLERLGEYDRNPLDYKKHFGKLKGKYPDFVKVKLTIEQLREIAFENDKKRNHEHSI